MNGKLRSAFLQTLVILSLVLAGCGDSGSDDPRVPPNSAEDSGTPEESPTEAPPEASRLTDRTVALVNDEHITVDDLAARVRIATKQLDDPDSIDLYTLNQLRENALQGVINERLIAQQAQKQQILVSEDDIQQQIADVLEEHQVADIHALLAEQGQSYEEWEQAQRDRLLLEKLVDLNMSSMIQVSEEEVRQDYEQNQEIYDRPAQVRAAQILTYDENRAQQALQALRNGGDFAEVAREYSESRDAAAGGDLGFFGEGVMPPEFDEVIFPLKIGDVSQIVKTQYGYQIFTLIERRDASRVSFDEAKMNIEERLTQKKRMFAIDLWMLDLQKEANILLNHTAIKQVQ